MAAEALISAHSRAHAPAVGAPARAGRLALGLTLLQVGLGLVLVWAALGKIARPHEFASNVFAYGLVNANASLLLAALLPWVELLAGVCLITGVFAESAMLVALGLFTMFAVVVSYALVNGLDISCGCFGESAESGVTRGTLARNLALVAAAGLAVFLQNKVSPWAVPVK